MRQAPAAGERRHAAQVPGRGGHRRVSDLVGAGDYLDIPLCEPLLDPDVVCFEVSLDLPYSYETRTYSSVVRTCLSCGFALCPTPTKSTNSPREHPRPEPRAVHPSQDHRPPRLGDARAPAPDVRPDRGGIHGRVGKERGHLPHAPTEPGEGGLRVERLYGRITAETLFEYRLTYINYTHVRRGGRRSSGPRATCTI